MPVSSFNLDQKDGALCFTHSKYFYQCTAYLPYAPYIYWNIHTKNDIIPVCTYGYKTLKSAQKQIASYVSDVKECRVIHIETEEEYKIYLHKWIARIRKSYENT